MRFGNSWNERTCQGKIVSTGRIRLRVILDRVSALLTIQLGFGSLVALHLSKHFCLRFDFITQLLNFRPQVSQFLFHVLETALADCCNDHRNDDERAATKVDRRCSHSDTAAFRTFTSEQVVLPNGRRLSAL